MHVPIMFVTIWLPIFTVSYFASDPILSLLVVLDVNLVVHHCVYVFTSVCMLVLGVVIFKTQN